MSVAQLPNKSLLSQPIVLAAAGRWQPGYITVTNPSRSRATDCNEPSSVCPQYFCRGKSCLYALQNFGSA
jgi:hypothetical protein